MAGRWFDWDYNVYGGKGHDDGGGFGRKDLEAMQAAGYSDAQIKILANLAPYRSADQGGPVKVYRPVQEYASNVAKPPWMYGKYGDPHFGQADVDAAIGQGKSLADIKGYAQFAREQGIGVGTSAQDWISDEEQKEFNKELLAQKEAHFADTLRIQQETAAEAARVQAEQFAKSQRVRSSTPTGVGGAASIRGSRLSITQPSGRGGTRRFARQGGAQYLNTLGIKGGGASTGNSTITL